MLSSGKNIKKINYKKLLLATTIMCMATCPVYAMSFEEALEKTYQENPDILIARSELDAVKVGKDIAETGYQPDVRGSFSAGFKSAEVNNGLEQTTEPQQMTLQVTQPLYRGGTTVAEIREANENISAQTALTSATEQDILLDTATAYVDVLTAESVLDLNAQNVKRLDEQLRAEQEKFRVGEATRTDVSQAKARLARAKAAKASAFADVNSARAVFHRLVGDLPINLKKPEMDMPVPASIEEALQIAQENSPELLATEYIEKASNERVSAIWGQLLPQIDLVGAMSKQKRIGSSTSSTSDINESSIVVQMDIPLYQSGSVRAQEKQARHVASRRRIEIIQARRTLENNIVSVWEDYQASLVEIDAFRTQVQANKLALEGVREEARLGTRTTLDILDAEQEYLDSKVSLVQAERDHFVSKCQFLRQIGWFKPNVIGINVSENVKKG